MTEYVLVWDLETIPDLAAGARMLDMDISARARSIFTTQRLGHQGTGLFNCGSDGARRVKSRFGYCRRV